MFKNSLMKMCRRGVNTQVIGADIAIPLITNDYIFITMVGLIEVLAANSV